MREKVNIKMKYLDSIYITKTYGGCLEGIPSEEETINYAKEKCKKLFYERPIHIVEYEVKKIKGIRNEEKCMLPKYLHIADIISYTPIKDGDGSHLAVIWFADDPSCNIEPIISKIEWKKFAEDWWI